jgi:nicotinate phosphoribosyltransferase
VSLVCKLHDVDGRPAVKLSDNYAKALGEAAEVKRYWRVFGTAGVANTPVLA